MNTLALIEMNENAQLLHFNCAALHSCRRYSEKPVTHLRSTSAHIVYAYISTYDNASVRNTQAKWLSQRPEHSSGEKVLTCYVHMYLRKQVQQEKTSRFFTRSAP